MKLTFLGAAGTVTGSKYLLEDGRHKILIDCGLFQGNKDLREMNWQDPPVDPASVSAIILTHAHLDHSGFIPRFAAQGFTGPVYCSAATRDLADILLRDSAHIQEEDAARANRYGYSRHSPALPLYTEAEAEAALTQFVPVPFNKTLAVAGDFFDVSFHRAGHILGAASVKISDGQTSIVFSGDIGRMNDPITKKPVAIEKADYLVMESTYGDRLHPPTDPLDALETIIKRTIGRGGTVVIPAFAVGRAQLLVYYIYKLKEAGRLPAGLPVTLDSPMAVDAGDIMRRHMNEHKLDEATIAAMAAGLRVAHTPADSKALDAEQSAMPGVIISASGMATGGRVLHHLKRFVGERKHTVLLAGFQAEGTRGRALEQGADSIKIHGVDYPVAAEIVKLDNMSAHADANELMEWLDGFVSPPRHVFLTHGEKTAAEAFCQRLVGERGWQASIPALLDSVEL